MWDKEHHQDETIRLMSTQDGVTSGEQARRGQGCPQHIVLHLLISTGQRLVVFGFCC